jgi:Phage tail protein (Tail_P2_I)
MTVAAAATAPTTMASVAEALYDALEPLAYADPENAWALFHLCNAIGNPAQVVHDLVSEGPNGEPGWSSLVDVERCPGPFLRWLAQLTGEHVPLGWSYEQQRVQIAGLWNWRRGTVPAIEHAVGRTLGGDKRVQVFERTPDPYSYTVQVRTSELPLDADGEPDPTWPEWAAKRTKPAGLNLTFVHADWEIVDGLEGRTVDELPVTVDELDTLEPLDLEGGEP